MKLRRSMLFVPGNNPGIIRDVHIYKPDSVMFDLEDVMAVDAEMEKIEKACGMEVGATKIMVAIETALGVMNCFPIAKSPTKRNIKLSYALGGITAPMVDLLESGLVDQLFDTQSFDLTAAESVWRNEKHVEVSADFYASIGNKSAAVNKLDFVILSALEIDIDFNVNVIAGSDGVIRAASGGHSDTAAMAKMSILVAPLTRGRLATIIDKVTTVVTPGSTVDVVVTDYGVIVNPRRSDLVKRFNKARVKMITMEEARKIATRLLGTPKEIEFSDEVVAVVEYRDGSIIHSLAIGLG